MKTILLTGFEAFAGLPSNPSQAIARALNNYLPAAWHSPTTNKNWAGTIATTPR